MLTLFKSFITTAFGKKADYSVFDTESWPKRDMEQHQRNGMEWQHARTQVERLIIEKEYGVRFTELLRLPYFDCIRFNVVDAMPKTLLGTARHMITIWKEKSLLSANDFQNFKDNLTVLSPLQM